MHLQFNIRCSFSCVFFSPLNSDRFLIYLNVARNKMNTFIETLLTKYKEIEWKKNDDKTDWTDQ